MAVLCSSIGTNIGVSFAELNCPKCPNGPSGGEGRAVERIVRVRDALQKGAPAEVSGSDVRQCEAATEKSRVYSGFATTLPAQSGKPFKDTRTCKKWARVHHQLPLVLFSQSSSFGSHRVLTENFNDHSTALAHERSLAFSYR